MFLLCDAYSINSLYGYRVAKHYNLNDQEVSCRCLFYLFIFTKELRRKKVISGLNGQDWVTQPLTQSQASRKDYSAI